MFFYFFCLISNHVAAQIINFQNGHREPSDLIRQIDNLLELRAYHQFFSCNHDNITSVISNHISNRGWSWLWDFLYIHINIDLFEGRRVPVRITLLFSMIYITFCNIILKRNTRSHFMISSYLKNIWQLFLICWFNVFLSENDIILYFQVNYDEFFFN